MDLSRDYFALFDLPRRFVIDEEALDRAWHALQAEVHPDQHACAPDADRRRAMQWSLRVNEAYTTLKKPILRAQYLLELVGVDAGIATNTAMAPEFLMEQMEWREAVAEARAGRDVDVLEQLRQRLRTHADAVRGHLARHLDERADYPAAADTVRQLMFIDKLRIEIDDALAVLED
ncbi:co-chaperone protein HscB [Betaproteobacteria bacterium]|nr:co-chaperone protein HscB [Betaproteobacteria bacterium]GHU00779.1 co-chaperone protein HscB [Betaproteobacteria bacterium]GHU25437.1 co-chaperone protein HscB [Betaproteobacteria bacterium]GHU31964.1 co-chaperone protein HscB [Betaproteobacteria bacterium]